MQSVSTLTLVYMYIHRLHYIPQSIPYQTLEVFIIYDCSMQCTTIANIHCSYKFIRLRYKTNILLAIYRYTKRTFLNSKNQQQNKYRINPHDIYDIQKTLFSFYVEGRLCYNFINKFCKTTSSLYHIYIIKNVLVWCGLFANNWKSNPNLDFFAIPL